MRHSRNALLVLAVAAAMLLFPQASSTQGLNPKRLIIGLASKQLSKYVKDNAPITLDWGDLYPTSADLPGPAFIPRDAYRATLAQYRQSPSGAVTLPPGDYALHVLVFCTHGGVQRLGSAQARWHEQFALGPLRGQRAEVLTALYARSAVQGVPYYPTQQVSWDITNGLKYGDFPDSQRTLFDRLVPEYRSAVGGSQLEQIQDKWRSLSASFPGLPTLDQSLNDLGSVGQTIRELQRSREVILQNSRDFDAEVRQLAPIVAGPADAAVAPQSWSKLSDLVYARMLVPADYHGIGSTTTLEVRVLPATGIATPAVLPVGKIIAYPNCVSCQPLTLEPVAAAYPTTSPTSKPCPFSYGNHSGQRYAVYPNEIRVGGDATWRYNDPGALTVGKDSDISGSGAIGRAPAGEVDRYFPVYPDMVTGVKRHLHLILGDFGALPLSKFFYSYAPKDAKVAPGVPKNDPKKYTEEVLKATGFSPDRTPNSFTPDELNKFAAAIATHEGGKPGTTYTPDSTDAPAWVKALFQACSASSRAI